MTDKQPSDRALAAAKAVAEEICQHMETESHGYQGSTDYVNEITFAEAAALIIDEHCPVQPGYDELLAACKELVAYFDVRPDSTLPADIKSQYRDLFRRDPGCQRALAALAAAKENPNGK